MNNEERNSLFLILTDVGVRWHSLQFRWWYLIYCWHITRRSRCLRVCMCVHVRVSLYVRISTNLIQKRFPMWGLNNSAYHNKHMIQCSVKSHCGCHHPVFILSQIFLAILHSNPDASANLVQLSFGFFFLSLWCGASIPTSFKCKNDIYSLVRTRMEKYNRFVVFCAYLHVKTFYLVQQCKSALCKWFLWFKL